MTRAVPPPLAKSGAARRNTRPSPSATQTCCSNLSQQDHFHRSRCDFLYCTLIKPIFPQRQSPSVELWGHVTKEMNKNKTKTVQLPNTDAADSDKSVAFPLSIRCGNSYSSGQPASTTPRNWSLIAAPAGQTSKGRKTRLSEPRVVFLTAFQGPWLGKEPLRMRPDRLNPAHPPR